MKGAANGAFLNPEIAEAVKKAGNKDLVIIGQFEGFCMTDTTKGAVDSGYTVFSSDETTIKTSPVQSLLVHKGVELFNHFSDKDYRRVLSEVYGIDDICQKNYPCWPESTAKTCPKGTICQIQDGKFGVCSSDEKTCVYNCDGVKPSILANVCQDGSSVSCQQVCIPETGSFQCVADCTGHEKFILP